jgi:HEAT repeat protein
MKPSRMLPLFLLATLASLGTAGLFAQETGSWAAELQSPDEGRRAKAAKELGKSGDPTAIPALTTAVSDSSPKVRREAVIALSSLRVRESLQGLITASRDTDQDIRILAIKGLVGYYTGQGPEVGFAGFWKRAWRTAKGRFVEENIRIDPGVRVDPEVVSALVAALNDYRFIEASREAADGLGILVAKTAVPDLVKACQSSDKSLVLVALNALAKIKDPGAGPQLVNLLDSPDEEIKQEAAVTTGILKANEALPRLQSMYENSPDKRTREKAMEGLAYLGDPVSVPFFTKALWNSDAEIRTSAAEGMARAGDKKVLAELERAVQAERDGDAQLAMQFAITALGRDDFLNTLIGDLSAGRRANYAQSYLVELSKNPEFLPRLYSYMNSRDSDVRRRLCTVLMFTGDRTSLDHLERLSHDPDGDVAREALRALRAVRVRVAAASAAAAESTGNK